MTKLTTSNFKNYLLDLDFALDSSAPEEFSSLPLRCLGVLGVLDLRGDLVLVSFGSLGGFTSLGGLGSFDFLDFLKYKQQIEISKIQHERNKEY